MCWLINSGLVHRCMSYSMGLRDPSAIAPLTKGLGAEKWQLCSDESPLLLRPSSRHALRAI
jgi:hypothetical protein